MQLTNDTDRMLCLIYNEFLNRRKIGMSKREAICFPHPSVLQMEFLQGIHEDDIVDALTELANNGLIKLLDGPEDKKGIGFALSIERLLLALESENIELPIDNTIDAFVVAMGEKAGDAGVKLTNDLRLAGYKVQSDYFDKKMKAQMKLADRYNAKFSIIIGDSELENGQYVVKDMKTYDQENVEFDNIVKYLEEKLKGEK